jgi:hypothetical protein
MAAARARIEGATPGERSGLLAGHADLLQRDAAEGTLALSWVTTRTHD